jgi:Zn-finger nucleic acid-binding protein
MEEEEIELSAAAEGINADCSICLSAMEQPVVLKACQHAFCLKCLQDWERFKPWDVDSKKCPLCRVVVLEADAAESLLTRARLLVSKATCDNLPKADRDRYKHETLAIVDQVITAGGDLPHIHAFITKADLLTLTGEYDKHERTHS